MAKSKNILGAKTKNGGLHTAAIELKKPDNYFATFLAARHLSRWFITQSSNARSKPMS